MDEVPSAEVDEIKRNETYPEEELRKEYEPTLDAPKNEPCSELDEPDGRRDNKFKESDKEGGGEM